MQINWTILVDESFFFSISVEKNRTEHVYQLLPYKRGALRRIVIIITNSGIIGWQIRTMRSQISMVLPSTSLFDIQYFAQLCILVGRSACQLFHDFVCE